MDNKNTLIAVVLMLGVWIAYSVLFVQPTPVVSDEPTVAVNDSHTPAAMETPEIVSQVPVAVPPSSTSISPRDILVETDNYRAVFSNVGGVLKSLALKKYRESADGDGALIQLVHGDDQVPTFVTVGFGDIGLAADQMFAVSEDTSDLHLTGSETGELTFFTLLNNNLVVQKTYHFRGDAYEMDFGVVLRNDGGKSLHGGVDFSLIQPWSEDVEQSRYSFTGPAILEDDSVETYKIDDLEEGPVRSSGSVKWTIFEDKYFMIGIVPFENSKKEVVLQKTDTTIQNIVKSKTIEIKPSTSEELDYALYAGPRDPEILESANYDLNKAIDFGFFDIIARPLLTALKFCYNHVYHNYGVAIILLTVFIKIIFWPLTHKSYKSMKDMQKLQPEMQRIRKKYQKDKERMNKEIMELYRNNRVNPMGGCLPMFVQIPVFFALYKVLLGSIALRHEPFVFWITDLSSKDPYYITPVIMGITMFVQQKMSPTTMDSQQAKFMLVLPIVFTFMFLNFPSGLVLYWLVNNVLTILQQWFINRDLPSTASVA